MVVQELFQAGKNVNNDDPIKIIVLLAEKVWYIIDVTQAAIFRYKILII